jgi:hypothetical protein
MPKLKKKLIILSRERLIYGKRTRKALRTGRTVTNYSKVLRYRVHFPQKCTFSGGVGNYLFMGKGIRREGVQLADFLNPVPIPQKTTFSVEV